MAKHDAAPAIKPFIIALPSENADYCLVRLDWLLAHQNPDNPKDHDCGEIMESIQRHGFVGCVTVDLHSEMLVVGHGRCETLGMLFDGDEQMPDRITEDTDGMWLVPTHVKWFETTAERDAYTIGDNQTTIKGGWNDGGLTMLLEKIHRGDQRAGLRGTGFDVEDLNAMIAARNYQSPIIVESPKIGGGYGVTVNVESREDEMRLVGMIEAAGYWPKPHSGSKK